MDAPKQHRHIALKILAGIAAGVGIFLVIKGFTTKAKAANAPQPANLPVFNPNTVRTTGGGGGSDPIMTSAKISPPVSGFPLQVGSTGTLVKQLQTALNNWIVPAGNTPLVVDGIFGSATQSALLSRRGKVTVDSQSELDAIISGSDISSGTSLQGINNLTDLTNVLKQV